MSQMDFKLHDKPRCPATYAQHRRAIIRKKAFDICVELRKPIPAVLRS